MRRTLNGVVLTKNSKYLTIKTEFGKTFKINIKHSTLTTGDKIHVMYDYTHDKVVDLLLEGELLPNPNAVEPEPEIDHPDLEDTSTLKIGVSREQVSDRDEELGLQEFLEFLGEQSYEL